MAFGRRNTPARQRLVVTGRARIVVLATSAAMLGGGAGGVLPALASSGEESACADPARTAPTVTLDDGVVVTCEPAGGPADTDAAGTTAGTTTAATTPPAEVDQTTGTATTTATTTPPPPITPPATPVADATAPPAGDQPVITAPAPPTHAGSGALAPGEEDPAARPAQRPAAGDDADEHVAPAGRPVHRSRGGHGPHRARTTAAPDPDDPAGAPEPSSDAAATYAALPAAWTSLTPLVLPASDADGFPIPAYLLPIYQAASAQYGVPWQVLAAINEIETDYGRNTAISSAGALGWMQFMPGSWARWGVDGDGDHRRDPRNPVDAIFAAARYLQDAGAATDLPRAVFAYNHADWYVADVIRRARELAGLDPALVAALTERSLRLDFRLYRAVGNPYAGEGATAPSAGQALLLTKRHLTRIVLRSADIHLDAGGRQDVVAGRIDRRVLATLVFLSRSGLEPTVSSLTTGHALHTTSGNISAHSYGHAVDIAAINGVPIAGHQGAGSVTAAALDALVRLQGYLEPNQIISLMTVDGHPNTLAMGDHDDHLHVGFPRVARLSA